MANPYNQSKDLLVVEVSPAGEILWTRLIQGNILEFGTDIELDQSGDVFIIGFTISPLFRKLLVRIELE